MQKEKTAGVKLKILLCSKVGRWEDQEQGYQLLAEMLQFTINIYA